MTQDNRKSNTTIHHYHYWDAHRQEWVLAESSEVGPNQTESPVKSALIEAADNVIMTIATWLLALFFLGWIAFPFVGWLVERSGLLDFMK